MLYGSQVKKVEMLLDKLFNESLPKLFEKSGDRSLPRLFKYGIKDVSLSISVGSVALSFTLGGEDAP